MPFISLNEFFLLPAPFLIFSPFPCTAHSVKLLYANRHDIRIISTNQSDHNETIVVDALEDAVALDFYYEEGLVFWADVGLQKIE